MTDKDQEYLQAFRELDAKQSHIDGMIKELRVICESLNDWQKMAQELGSLGGTNKRPEWSESRLQGLTTLRGALLEYDRLAAHLSNLWGSLTANERKGLAAPESLRRDKS